MDWITLDSISTVAGAAGAIALVVAVVKAVAPSITGRATQICALALSLAIAALLTKWTQPSAAITSILNACVLFFASMGADQAVNYKKEG